MVDPEGRPVPSFTARTRASDGRAGGFDRAQNEQGTFAIENVPEGEYAVEIQARNFVTEALSKVIVSSGEATDLGTLRLRRGGTIEGTVVDSSEEPVPGASIAVRAPGFRAYGSVSYDASSDRRGRFRIEGLPDGAVSLLATHPSYAQSRIERLEIDARAGTTEVEIVMRRGGALEGVVRSRDGSDIGGRTIQVIPDPRGFRGVGDSSVQTDPDGVFRFEHVPAGSAEVQLLWTSPPATYTVQRKEVEICRGRYALRRVPLPEGPGFGTCDERGLAILGSRNRALAGERGRLDDDVRHARRAARPRPAVSGGGLGRGRLLRASRRRAR